MQTMNSGPIQESAVAEVVRRQPSSFKYLLYYLRNKPLGTFGFSIVVIMILAAIFAPVIAPFSYQEPVSYTHLRAHET